MTEETRPADSIGLPPVPTGYAAWVIREDEYGPGLTIGLARAGEEKPTVGDSRSVPPPPTGITWEVALAATAQTIAQEVQLGYEQAEIVGRYS